MQPTVLDQFRLNGKVAVITGGSRGLGKAMAAALAEAGAAVVVTSRSAEACARALDEIQETTGRDGLALATDVTDANAVARLVKRTHETFGHIDVWINSAGLNIRHPIEDFPAEEYDTVLDVNLKGSWLCCRAVGRIMREQQAGSVINVGSVLSTVGLAERTAYCASKAGILGLTRALALEWAPAGVRCNALCPGPFLTEINRPLLKTPDRVQALLDHTAFKRWGELSEIQGAAGFLASSASSFMTGAALTIDGGWSAA